ncbi:hypothetical protein GEMRC1_011499 [Eukaryota sp. GEM-RC1]
MDSLNGNSFSLLIGTVTPASLFYDETISTLSYCSLAKKIKTNPVRTTDDKGKEVELLRRELERENGHVSDSEGSVLIPFRRDSDFETQSVMSSDSQSNHALIALSEVKTTLARNGRRKPVGISSVKNRNDVEGLRKANNQLRHELQAMRRQEALYVEQIEKLLERDLSDCLSL